MGAREVQGDLVAVLAWIQEERESGKVPCHRLLGHPTATAPVFSAHGGVSPFLGQSLELLRRRNTAQLPETRGLLANEIRGRNPSSGFDPVGPAQGNIKVERRAFRQREESGECLGFAYPHVAPEPRRAKRDFIPMPADVSKLDPLWGFPQMWLVMCG